MTNQEIYKKIEDLYQDQKSKNFIVHLLRNFFPADKTHAVFFRPEKDGKPVLMKCCLTGKKLYAKDHGLEILMKHGDEIAKNRIDSMIASVNQREMPTLLDSEKQLGEVINSLALSSETSDKYLSREGFQELYNFWATEILKGNKHLNWIARSQQTNAAITSLEKKDLITPKEKKTIIKASNNAKMSLGDLEVLQQLKNKLDSETEK